MKITLDQPLCIYDIGRRSMQQDYVFPAFGEAQCSDRHFMVAEGPIAGVYLQKVSLTLSSGGIRINVEGNCRAYQVRPGYDEPVFISNGAGNVKIDDIQTGDWFLLMSDGMCESLSVEDLVAIVNRPDWTAEHKRDALLDYTSENEDNHSAYLLHVRSVEDDAPMAEPVEAEDNSDREEASADKTTDEQPKEPSKLMSVDIGTELQDQNVDLSGASSMLDISAKAILYVIIAAYVLALIAGFFIGLLN